MERSIWQGTQTDFLGTYVGEFKDGKRHGQGTFTNSRLDGGYVGEWKDGEKHGQGTETVWHDGTKIRSVGKWRICENILLQIKALKQMD